MHAVLRRRVAPASAFPAVAIGIYVVEILIACSSALIDRSSVIALAVTIDLTIVVPLLYWILVVRRGHAPRISVAGVFIASLVGARVVLPPDHREFLRHAELLVVPLELAVVWYVAAAVRRGARAARGAAAAWMDVPERIAIALREAGAHPRVAGVLTTELSILYFAFLSWGREWPTQAGVRRFTYHRGTGITAIFGALLFASIVELIAVDFLLRLYSHRLAWAVSALSAFGALWIFGFLRALQRRPILLERDMLHVRAGLQWSASIPLSSIEAVRVGRVTLPLKGTTGYLRITPLVQPNVLLTLREPVLARGGYGLRRSVTIVSLAVDAPKELAQALASAGV